MKESFEPQAMEALEEIAADIDLDLSALLELTNLSLSRQTAGKPKPASTNFPQIFVATNKAGKRRPGASELINRASQKARRSLTSVEREWVDELASGRRYRRYEE